MISQLGLFNNLLSVNERGATIVVIVTLLSLEVVVEHRSLRENLVVHGNTLCALFLVLLAQLLAHVLSTMIVDEVGHIQEFCNEFLTLGNRHIERCHVKLNVQKLRGNNICDLDI